MGGYIFLLKDFVTTHLGNDRVTESQILEKIKGLIFQLSIQRGILLRIPERLSFDSCFCLDSPEDEKVRPP